MKFYKSKPNRLDLGLDFKKVQNFTIGRIGNQEWNTRTLDKGQKNNCIEMGKLNFNKLCNNQYFNNIKS